MPVPMGSVQVKIIMKLSRASCAVSRSELVEPCAATCFVRGIVGRCFEMLGKYDVRWYQYNKDFLYSGINYAEKGLSQLLAERMCIMWAMSLRHAASDTVFRPSLLMGARAGSAVNILVVAPCTSNLVRRVLDNHYVQHYVGGRKCSNQNTSSYVSDIRPTAVRIRYTYCC